MEPFYCLAVAEPVFFTIFLFIPFDCSCRLQLPRCCLCVCVSGRTESGLKVRHTLRQVCRTCRSLLKMRRFTMFCFCFLLYAAAAAAPAPCTRRPPVVRVVRRVSETLNHARLIPHTRTRTVLLICFLATPCQLPFKLLLVFAKSSTVMLYFLDIQLRWTGFV